MGCTSFNSISDINSYQQQIIELDLSNNVNGLSYANSLINLITRMRNKIIYLYHKLIYDTGACVFINPNICHCVDCIFYKVSCEFEGNLQNSDIIHREDPPYLKLSSEKRISDISTSLFNELFNFIIEIISYKTLIKQIDKETPELFYLIYEKKNKLTKKNKELINQGIELFKNIKEIKYEILNKYKNHISEFAFRKDSFCKKIDKVGRIAYDRNITDIYEIPMLLKEIDINEDKKNKKSNEIQLFKNVDFAKEYMENIINNEKNEDIIEFHDSIVENLNDSKINDNYPGKKL